MTVSWVQCPICEETGMRCETDPEGHTLIHCVNHGCASNRISENSTNEFSLVGRLIIRLADAFNPYRRS